MLAKTKSLSKINHLVFILLLLITMLSLLIIYFLSQNQLSKTTNAARNIMNSCNYTNDKEQCYSRGFKILTEQTNIDFAKETLFELQILDPQNANGCHLIAHSISIAETHKQPQNWLNLLKEQDVNACSGGFLHGVLEAHMSSDPEFVLDVNQFLQICSQVKNQQRGRLSCNHNLGHLLLVQENHNFNSAIVVCNGIRDFAERYECLSGMFMENLTRINLEAHGISELIPWNMESITEVEKLCNSHKNLPAQACWKVISYLYTSVNKADPQGLFNYCYQRTPTQKIGDECFIYGIGNMTTFTIFDHKNLDRMCTFFSSDDSRFHKCMSQVLGTMLGSTLQFAEEAINMCNYSYTEYKEQCFKTIGIKLAQASYDSKITICNKVPAEYQKTCINSEHKVNL
jgi:hypothetical protein